MRVALKISITVVAAILIWLVLRYAGHHAGAARQKHVPLPVGAIRVPHERTEAWAETSALHQEVLEHWAVQDILDWQEKGKVTVPRVLMGKLALKQDVAEVNAYLLRQVPRGNSGSKWWLHPQGDYDFTLAGLTAILYLFGEEPELLYPDTRDHLLSVLLTNDGGSPQISVPRTLGLIRDTENHLLMAEGSRYLKNQWLRLHGNEDAEYDNVANGLETWLLSMLDELNTAGLYEFNSMPYHGYTMTALMNLEAFGSEAVSRSSRDALDQLNWKYALGSLSLRRFAPFRRQLVKASVTSLNKDYHTALMKVWMSFRSKTSLDLVLNGGYHHALWACLLPYRLPDRIADWVESKPHPYLARFGHGSGASPEIYSGGPGYLISAGGVHRGKRSMIVARPITLMLDDGAQDLAHCFHLAGPGDDFRKWNNTGVHRDFACTAGTVHIPEGWRPSAESEQWAIYQANENLCIAIHSRADFGILCIFREGSSANVLHRISEANPSPEALHREFQWPEGILVTYDVHAPKQQWVISSVGGQPIEREHAQWPLMDGEPMRE